MYGALIQLAGMGYNAEMQSNATHKALNKNRKVRAAEQQYGGYAADDEKQTTDYLKWLSLARLKNQGELAGNISGKPMLDAGEDGEADYDMRLDETLGRGGEVMRSSGRGLGRSDTGAAGRWGTLARARSAPRLQSQGEMVRFAGRRQGEDRYRQDQMNSLAEASINLDRKTSERLRRSALLDAYRQRKLSEIMRKNGVDTGEAGMRAQGQLVQSLAGVGGSALNSYSANQPASDPGGYSNSTTASNRPQGPSRYP